MGDWVGGGFFLSLLEGGIVEGAVVVVVVVVVVGGSWGVGGVRGCRCVGVGAWVSVRGVGGGRIGSGKVRSSPPHHYPTLGPTKPLRPPPPLLPRPT